MPRLFLTGQRNIDCSEMISIYGCTLNVVFLTEIFLCTHSKRCEYYIKLLFVGMNPQYNVQRIFMTLLYKN